MNTGRLSSFVRFCMIASTKLGVLPTCKWIFSTLQLNLKINRPSLVCVWPKFLLHPVKLRARTSDPFIFRQIMIEDEYCPLKDLRITTMIDLGANIGLSSAWFLSRFPDANAFAVEASPENYASCCENLKSYGNRARVVHGAAWSKAATLVLRRGKHCSTNQVRETECNGIGEFPVQAWGVANLVEMSGFSQIDLLKIDIEGAEEAIFSADVSGWLPCVRNLCIELHGEGCRDTFFGALAGYDFGHAISGELDLCTNLKPKTKAQ